ncbi:MAG: NAD(P)/FAD-dependent oxidoreductase [Vulcanimicrobiaceae bacterium]
MPRVLILGGGFAGLAVAARLEKLLRPGEAEVTLVSRDNYALFTPMLPEVSSGDLEARHIISPLRATLHATELVLGEVQAIDLGARRVEVHLLLGGKTKHVAYDHLVLATGSVTATFGIPGVAEHSIPFKRLEDAEMLRNRIVETLEVADVETDRDRRASLLTYAIVGGGYTGVEIAGQLVDFFRGIVRFYRTIEYDDIRIVLVEGGPKLLPDLLPRMGEYCVRLLKKRNVEVRVEALVSQIDADGVSLKDGSRIDAATVVWSAGVRPSPLIAALPLPHARNGGILVQGDMSVAEHPGLWALGDCAWIPNPKGGYYPATAQHAIREGPLLAENVVRVLREEPTQTFRWQSLGTMASLGEKHGVVGFPNGFVLTGFPAWWLWRTYYLSRIPGLYRKTRVALDWLLALIFPRDIAQVRVDNALAQREAREDAGLH